MKNLFAKWARNGLIIALLLAATLGGFATGQIESDERTPEPIGDAKHVFLFIGDGVGIPQISAAEAYIQSQESSDIGIKKLSFSDFPAQSLTTTHAQDRFITGSAAAATAIACGYKTTIGTIAMDGGHTRNYESIADMSIAKGMKVGIVSSVDIDHATPACFYAHTPSRSNYYDIGLQMANSDFDYFGGGRVRLSKTPDGKKTVPEIMEEKGWIVADTRQ